VGENTSQIEQEIRAERTELGRNLRELETKARDLADWRTHYQSHSALFLTAAFGGGVLLGLLATPSRVESHAENGFEGMHDVPREPSRLRMPHVVQETRALAGRQLGQTWHGIADALLGVVSAKAVEFISDLVPGFRDHYSGADRTRPSDRSRYDTAYGG
jgi:hypothetical protein